MQKIASPKELQAELRGLIARCEESQPSRTELAAEMRKLADKLGVSKEEQKALKTSLKAVAEQIEKRLEKEKTDDVNVKLLKKSLGSRFSDDDLVDILHQALFIEVSFDNLRAEEVIEDNNKHNKLGERHAATSEHGKNSTEIAESLEHDLNNAAEEFGALFEKPLKLAKEILAKVKDSDFKTSKTKITLLTKVLAEAKKDFYEEERLSDTQGGSFDRELALEAVRIANEQIRDLLASLGRTS
jgi:hypothetical protein